ncbi:MAG: hypothetical protein Q4A41_01700, partial [Bacillota bacterium]|nr:hypothetical protein [Bacillota bacterium]
MDNGKRRRRSRLNYKRIAMAVFLLIAIATLLIYFFFIRNSFQSDKTIELKYGELDLSSDFTALVVRNEKVIYALSSG